jgi:uncharacterized protein YjaG (DUF416 family)
VNAPLLLSLIVTATLAITGWYVLHRLSLNRDEANKRRDLRVQYLLEAYRKLENASNRQDLPLIADLRAELRRELRLGPLPDRIVVFRHEPTKRRT